jgi:hypothetical protein
MKNPEAHIRNADARLRKLEKMQRRAQAEHDLAKGYELLARAEQLWAQLDSDDQAMLLFTNKGAFVALAGSYYSEGRADGKAATRELKKLLESLVTGKAAKADDDDDDDDDDDEDES